MGLEIRKGFFKGKDQALQGYQDVLRTPRVAISIDGVVTPYDAEPVRAPDGHARIRAALREKYGFRDAWAGLVVDTKHSVAVCLRAPGALARAPYPD